MALSEFTKRALAKRGTSVTKRVSPFTKALADSIQINKSGGMSRLSVGDVEKMNAKVSPYSKPLTLSSRVSEPGVTKIGAPTGKERGPNLVERLRFAASDILTGGGKRREFELVRGRRPETFAEQLSTSGLLSDNPIVPFLTRSNQESGELLRNRLMKQGVSEERATEIATKIKGQPNIFAEAQAKKELNLNKNERKAVAIRSTLEGLGMLVDLPLGIASILPESTIAKQIAKSKVADDILKILKKKIPNMADDVAEASSKILVHFDNADDVADVLNKLDFKVNAAKGTGKVSPEAISPPKRALSATDDTIPTKVPKPPVRGSQALPAGISKELQPLAEEARKYKSAEEFVKNNDLVFQGVGKGKQSDFLTTNIGEANSYATQRGLRGEGEIRVFRFSDLPDEIKTITKDDANYEQVLETFGKDFVDKPLTKEQFSKIQSAIGFNKDEIAKLPEVGRIAPDPTGLKAESQLTDFYNKVTGKAGNAVPDEIVSEVAKSSTPGDIIPILRKQFPGAKERTVRSISKKLATVSDPSKVARHLQRLDDVVKEERARPDSLTEEASFEVLAEQQKGGEYALHASRVEEDRVVSNLESVFADVKGVSLEDTKLRFTEEDLFQAQTEYDFAVESLINDPARALSKYANRNGVLPEVTATEYITSPSGTGRIKNGEFGRRGDDIVTELGFNDSEEAREAYVRYRERHKKVKEYHERLKAIRHNIQLAKQKSAFVGKEKNRLAREVATNQRALRSIVEAAEQAGFRKGVSKGSEKYAAMVSRLKGRRGKVTAIKKAFNLTDGEMKKIRGNKDPRWMDEGEFSEYLGDLQKKAEIQDKRNKEKVIIKALIEEKNLKKTENLQKALEFPPVNDMSLEQLVEFGDILATTKPDDVFLGPRMIQTAVNTDLGNIRTVGEGIEAVAKQTGMPLTSPVEGKKIDRWLRDPTLVERDPLHKAFITEWVAKEAEVLTREYALKQELNKLARAARKSRRKTDAGKRGIREKVFSRLAPKDELIVKWLQPFETHYDDNGRKFVVRVPEIRTEAEAAMTVAELRYAKFLEKFFSHYYDLAAEEAMTRWTLLGVKKSRYKQIYYTHMSRRFFERWRDDGFIKAIKIAWDKNVAETKVDFNAFGDRGEVLGYEKWLNRSMTREGEGIDPKTGNKLYTQNTAKVAMSYFHAFERKLILDSMIPKIKLLEFLMGKRFQTPKSITNPEGTEQVHSQLRKHINEWINNKKGQRVQMVYEQGDRAEVVVDGLKTFVALQHLGANVIAQVLSGLGGEAATFAGTSIKGWATGHKRALTKTGRSLAQKYGGAIGETPWNDLASAANDIGDTLRSGFFYIFGDLSYRARRQMFLGLLTKEEFSSGVVSPKRVAEIKLQIGKWHQMPEFRSIAGSTSLVKAGGMYTEWAVPILQNVHLVLLPRLRNMVRSTSPKDWPKIAASDEFKTLFRTVVGGVGLGATAYLLLNPDENDRTTLGYIRRKAAQEISTTIQAISLWGIPTPFAILNGYIDSLRTAITLMLTLERYKTAGPGHAAGDLKGPPALFRTLVPRGVQQFLPEPETPIKTKQEVKEEIREALNSGELSVSAAKDKYIKELKKIENKEKERSFEMSPEDYKKDLKERLNAGDISVQEGKKEFIEYLEEQEKYSPEQFESDSESSFIGKMKMLADSLDTDPVTAFQVVFTGEEIRRLQNGEIILHRGKTSDPIKQREFSLEKRKELDATASLTLEHMIPLSLGGDNSDSNLKLVPNEDHDRWTPVETFLWRTHASGEIEIARARQLILDLKAGTITEEEVYSAVED